MDNSSSSFIEDFLLSVPIKFRKNESGSKHTTLAVGGSLQFLIEPNTEAELLALFKFIAQSRLNYHVLGAGSNLIIPDIGVADLVIRMGRGFRYSKPLGEISSDNFALYEVGSAMALMSLSRELSEQGFSGLEFAGGIPASLGGAVRMNAGAHKDEMSGIIEEVKFINSQAEIVVKNRKEIQFSYRHSGLPLDALIISAIIKLKKGDPLAISSKRREFLDYRKSTQPLTVPSFGSVFKNPAPDKAAGMLIEKSKLKGFVKGGASVSSMHANWIVNLERKATATEVIQLMDQVVQKVREDSGITLEREVVCW